MARVKDHGVAGGEGHSSGEWTAWHLKSLIFRRPECSKDRCWSLRLSYDTSAVLGCQG